jgi:hypothetical protein
VFILKTFKRISAVILSLIITLAFAACGDKSAEIRTDADAANTAVNTDSGDEFESNGAAQAVKAYFRTVEITDTPAFISLLPEFDMLLYKSTPDVDAQSVINDSLKAKLNRYEEKYGVGITFDITVIKVESVTDKVLDSIRQIYAENTELADIVIGEGTEVEFEITVKGSDGEAKGNGEAHAIQENGVWKIHNMNLDI